MRKLLIFFVLNTTLTFSQQTKDEVLAYQKEIQLEYLNPDESPLPKEEIANFEGIKFFDYNANFVVEAKLQRLLNEKPFLMPTSSGKSQSYIRFGILTFSLQGKQFQLEVYQNLNLIKREGYEKSLFLPFIDQTSGNESYGAGRYLDISIPDNDTILLDFNKAYHPYCAYTAGYSCPITPDINFIDISLKAGVKY